MCPLSRMAPYFSFILFYSVLWHLWEICHFVRDAWDVGGLYQENDTISRGKIEAIVFLLQFFYTLYF